MKEWIELFQISVSLIHFSWIVSFLLLESQDLKNDNIDDRISFSFKLELHSFRIFGFYLLIHFTCRKLYVLSCAQQSKLIGCNLLVRYLRLKIVPDIIVIRDYSLCSIPKRISRKNRLFLYVIFRRMVSFDWVGLVVFYVV